MDILLLLIPVTLLLAGIGLALFLWAVQSGQFDDLHSPAIRIFAAETPSSKPVATLPGVPSSPESDFTQPNHPAQPGERHKMEKVP